MNSLWNESEAAACQGDPLKLRVYTSRLIGKDPALVLHGGGNTSVKAKAANLFGETEEILYVKGSGWDLATIEPQGFSPVRMETLLKLAKLESLSDSDMVRVQKSAMTDPNAPAPSVEAILHALIPFQYVDHTHADAVVAVSNTPGGPERMRSIYGDRVLYVPYCMPGFILAKKVFELARGADWNKYEGMVLLHHGIFSFANDAKTSYERMVKLVSQAEDFIRQNGKFTAPVQARRAPLAHATLAKLRRDVSRAAGTPMLCRLNASDEALSYSNLPDVATVATRGPLTPDHVIHTKRTPLIIERDDAIDGALAQYVSDYKKYFERNTDGKLTCLDPAPRWAVWPQRGVLAFGANTKRTNVVADIVRHTMRGEQWAESLGGWKALPEKDIFEVEYWELEQAKLKKGGGGPPAPFQGKVALVTGAASGIGKSCAESLRSQGAAVAVLDISPKVAEVFKGSDVLPLVCDVTDSKALEHAVQKTIETFGGLDILVSNAGSFPPGKNIANLDDETWNKTVEVNLSSHHYLLRTCVPYLELGLDPAVVIIASKNVPAPGPGAAAYSAAKAGLTQLARVAALELGPKGIRVNVLHPNAVFDTGIWTPEILENRARHYGLALEEYKTNNVLKVEVSSKDVAALASALAGPLFAKTTGAQIAVDGGNDRVI